MCREGNLTASEARGAATRGNAFALAAEKAALGVAAQIAKATAHNLMISEESSTCTQSTQEKIVKSCVPVCLGISEYLYCVVSGVG